MSEDILRRWYKAHKTAEENPKLLLRFGDAKESTRIGKLCSERMVECGLADEELLKLEGIPLVELFKEATNNRPKCGCTLRAFRGDYHCECWRKLKEWFAYREALMVFIFENYIRDTEYMQEYRLAERLQAEDIGENILRRLSYWPVVGDVLEKLPHAEYDDLEEEIVGAIERGL